MFARLRAGVGIAIVAFGLTTIHGHAGSNGQEIDYLVLCDSNWSHAMGYNQNSQYVDQYVYTPASQDSDCSSRASYQKSGWWWVGSVHIEGWGYYDGNAPDGYNGEDYCNVPQSYQDWDYWGCDTP